MQAEASLIDDFLAGGPYGVAGASTQREKYGNKVLRCFQQNHKQPLFPINPAASEVEGLPSFPDLASLPEVPRSLSIITPPKVTLQLVREAVALGVQHLWMQPGAEHPDAIAEARAAGLGVIAGGPCLLVVLGYRE